MAQDNNYDRNAELLRQALPLMSKYRIPATPDNYGVWYQYVAGDNAQLRMEIDDLIGREAEFTAQINRELFKKYGADCNIDRIEGIRGNLQVLMEDVNSTLVTADRETDDFGGNLNQFSHSIQGNLGLSDVQQLLGSLIVETGRMQEITKVLQQHIMAKTQEVENLQKELNQERTRARTDLMTNLFNRSAFLEALQDSLRQDDVIRRGRLCLLMLDIDHFKAVNDTHGHLVGDRVIKFVAETIRKCIKGRDIAARYGGEEFAVLLDDTPKEGARRVGQQILFEISSAKLLRADTKQPLGPITISIGLAVYKPGEELLDFLERADQALYQAKRRGRNRLFADQSC
ncbi:MAG: GGDEF domain-containing protein [Gammaproteobacteria bacterium SHHR-1]|uniref:GGDEF domain-containing protein n=1 Tax=Magnetovirga frankeli TaxID=947516 RepID=UPI001292E712|nr:GGDEF domain-containing protein [gamma proteobacterium SS-5]